MFRHVVMFRWADDVDTAHVGEIARRLDELPDAIDEISSYRHGADALANEGNFD